MLSNEKFQEFLGFLERAKKSETILSQRLATLANQHEINTSEWQALLDHVSEIQAYLSALMSYRRPSLQQMDQHALHHLFSSDMLSTESSAPTTHEVSTVSMLAAVAQNVSDGIIPNQSLGEASSLFPHDLSVPHQSNPPMQNPNVMDANAHHFGEPTMYRHDDEAEFYHQYPQTNNVRSNVDLEYADDTIDEAYQYGRPDYIDPPVAQVPYRMEQSREDHQEQWTTEHYDGVQVMRGNYGESETEPNYEYRESSFHGQGYESYASVSAGNHRRTPRKQSRGSPQHHPTQAPHNQPPNRRPSRKRRDNGRIPQWLFFGRVNPKCTVKDFLGALNRHEFRVINTIRVHKGDKWNYVPKVKLETPQQMNDALRMRITIFNTSVNVKPYIENEEASGGYPSDSRRPHSARSMQRKKRNRLVKRNTSRRSSPRGQSMSGTVTPNQRIPNKMDRENENILGQDGEVSPNCDRNSRESDEVDVSSGIREKILELNINHGNTPSGLAENDRFSNNVSCPEHDVTASAGEVG